MFTNLKELITTMQDENVCREYLAKQRWIDGKAVCPFCGHTKCYSIEKGKRYKCADKTCYGVFSVTTKTIFHASNIPLSKWFMAIYLTSANKKGISSYQLGKHIGIAQNSAWFMLHRIRKMMQVNNVQLENIVESDLTYVGGKISNKSNKVRKEYAEKKEPFANKTSVLGLTERQGATIMTVVPEDQERMVDAFLRDNVKPQTTVVTDEGTQFKSLSDTFNHNTINHRQNEYARLHFHTNSIEGVFSHFKRMVVGTYHQLSYKHTQQYLNEFTYRFNSRKIKDADRFVATLQNINIRLPYKILIASPDKVKKTIKEKMPNGMVQRKAVIQLLDGVIIGEYKSARDAERATGIHSSDIGRCANGIYKQAGGYQWIFA